MGDDSWRRRALTMGALFIGCATPTQITIDISTTALCPEEVGEGDRLSSTLISAAPNLSGSDMIETTTTTTCAVAGAANGRDNAVGTLVLVPSDSNESRTVEVAVFAGVTRPNGDTRTSEECRDAFVAEETIAGLPCILVRRRMGFVDNVKLYLPIRLETDCVGVQCGADQTCSSGSCIDASVECNPSTGVCGQGEGGGSGSTTSAVGTGGAGTTTTAATGAGGLDPIGAGGGGIKLAGAGGGNIFPQGVGGSIILSTGSNTLDTGAGGTNTLTTGGTSGFGGGGFGGAGFGGAGFGGAGGAGLAPATGTSTGTNTGTTATTTSVMMPAGSTSGTIPVEAPFFGRYPVLPARPRKPRTVDGP